MQQFQSMICSNIGFLRTNYAKKTKHGKNSDRGQPAGRKICPGMCIKIVCWLLWPALCFAHSPPDLLYFHLMRYQSSVGEK